MESYYLSSESDYMGDLPSYAVAASEQHLPRLEAKRQLVGPARRPGGPRQALRPLPLRPVYQNIPPALIDRAKPKRKEFSKDPPVPPPAHPTPPTHPNEKDFSEIEIDSSCLDDLDEQLLVSPMDSFADLCWADAVTDEGPPELTLSLSTLGSLRLSMTTSTVHRPVEVKVQVDEVTPEKYEDLDPFAVDSSEEEEEEWFQGYDGEEQDEDDLMNELTYELSRNPAPTPESPQPKWHPTDYKAPIPDLTPPPSPPLSSPPSPRLRPIHEPIRLEWCPPINYSHSEPLLASWEPHFTTSDPRDGVNAFPSRPHKTKNKNSSQRWKRLHIFAHAPGGPVKSAA